MLKHISRSKTKAARQRRASFRYSDRPSLVPFTLFHSLTHAIADNLRKSQRLAPEIADTVAEENRRITGCRTPCARFQGRHNKQVCGVSSPLQDRTTLQLCNVHGSRSFASGHNLQSRQATSFGTATLSGPKHTNAVLASTCGRYGRGLSTAKRFCTYSMNIKFKNQMIWHRWLNNTS